jgi:hypothetical protein
VAGIGFCGAPRRIDDWREDVLEDDECLETCVKPDVDEDAGLNEDVDEVAVDEVDKAGVTISLLVVEGIAEKSDSDQPSKSSCNDNRGGNAVNRLLLSFTAC